MPYAPQIDELGPRLISSGFESANNSRLAGASAIAGVIGNTSSAIAGGVGKAVLTQQEISELGGSVQAMHDAGYISDDDVAAFNEGNIGKKRGLVGEWKAKSTLMRAEELDQFKTGQQIRQDSNYIGQQAANASVNAQLDAAAQPPKYEKVVTPGGDVIFVAPNAPAIPAMDANGRPVKQQQSSGNPLMQLLGGGSAAPQPAAAPGAGQTGGYQVGRKYSGMTYLGGDPNDANSWQK